MVQVDIHEAKTHFSRLVDRAAAGEEIIIAKDGKPLVQLTPVKRERQLRSLGSMRGKIWISDDFDAEDPEIIALFEGTHPDSTNPEISEERRP